MYHHEDSVLVTWIAKNVFQIHRIAFAQMIVIPAAHCAVDVHLQVQRTGLRNQRTEDVVLKNSVLICGRHASGMIFVVNSFRLLARRVGNVHQRPKIGGFKFYRHGAMLLIQL